jgi:hypothetical protein
VGFWDEFEHDPRSEANAHLRASDRDRDVVHGLLGTAYADGRLDRTEFDERTTRVSTARTLAELPPIVADLVAATSSALLRPAELRAEAERRYRADRREALTYLGPAIICWVIWAAVLVGGRGTWFPWPVFVTIGTGMPFLRLLLNPEDHIVARQRRLEKKQARALTPRAPERPGRDRPAVEGGPGRVPPPSS